MIGIGVGHIKDRIETERMIEALVTVDQGRVQEQLQIGTESDALNVKKYYHLARDCPTMQANREDKQIQQMFNMDEDQRIIQTQLMDVDQDGQTIHPVETRDNLNL